MYLQALRRLAPTSGRRPGLLRPPRLASRSPPVPQTCVEFEVQDGPAVQAAAEELRGKGFTLLHEAREKSWGQTVARLPFGRGR